MAAACVNASVSRVAEASGLAKFPSFARSTHFAVDGDLALPLIDSDVPNVGNELIVFNSNGQLNLFSNLTSGQRLETTDGLGSFVVQYGPVMALFTQKFQNLRADEFLGRAETLRNPALLPSI